MSTKPDQIKTSAAAAALPWDKFSNWLHCVCVVTFDLELGQSLEIVYPGHIQLTEKEKTNICYLAFPDSNSGCMGDTKFHFRIRQCTVHKRFLNKEHIEYNRDCPPSLKADSGHFYGHVYFRQVKDKSLRRGYFQKSVVLVSRLPFHQLFSYILDIIAPEYFENSDPSIEAACHDIDQWHAPVPGATLNLPIMGSVVQVRVPSQSDKPSAMHLSVDTNAGQVEFSCTQSDADFQLIDVVVQPVPAPQVLPSLHEVDIYTCFLPVLSHVQLLWELVLINEPLVVMAPSPGVCSETVLGLTNMILPLRYCTDCRPFFTIHDSEFREFTTRTQAPPPVLLGVTNPFFAKTLQHWPHIVRIGEGMSFASQSKSLSKLKKGGNLKTVDSKPGMYTQYKAFLNKDKSLLKRLAKGSQSERPSEVQTAILKRYFLELTQSFMIPLERYVASLMPLKRNILPYKGTPGLRPFDIVEFLGSLDHVGPQLTSGLKGDWIGLYRKFFKSENFEGWYHMRIKEVNQKLQVLHLETLCQADLSEWVSGRCEVEIVDLLLRIKDKMALVKMNRAEVNDEMLKRLRNQISNVIATLPDDLRTVLTNSMSNT